MSEVKRYLADDAYPGQYSARCDLVPASAYDAAQSQLAAFREELAQTKRTAITEILALNSTLREQAKSLAAMSDRELEIAAEHADDLQQRLADAERRNSELVGLLRSVWECSEIKGDEWKRINFYLNPNPEAASHD